MRDLVMLQRVTLWVLFFASSVYGHVAMKLAVGERGLSYRDALWQTATSFWGWSTVVAWGASCLLWVMLLSREKLLVATSVSSFSYVLICIAAWMFLRERITTPQVAGALLIAAGIFLIK